MKHFLRTVFLLTLVGFSALGRGQTGSCSVTDLVLENARLIDEATCTYAFDVAFTIEKNKFIFFQTYVENNSLITTNPYPYPNYWDCQNGTTTHQGAGPDAPTNGEVGTPLLNVAIHDPQPNDPDVNPVFVNYIPDPTVPIVGVVSTTTVDKFELPDGRNRVVIKGLQVSLPPSLCGKPFVVITDFFATNADRNTNGNNTNLPIQCVSCGVRFAVGFYTATGLAICPPDALPASNGQYIITLTNNTTLALSGTYQVFVDVNDNGSYTPGIDVQVSPTGTSSFSIAVGPGTQTILTGTVPQQYTGLNLILVTSLTDGFATGATTMTVIPIAACSQAPNLPVHMKSFTATRKNQDVLLTWETATEDNNRGFYVQRNTGSGWKDLGFVASQTKEGNSSSILAYSYNDLNNNTRNITQYRIMQVDIDGKAKLSEVRQVRGLNQAGKVTVYPNPSADGKVNVVFEDSKAAMNISVSDMNGRTIRQFKGASNSVIIDNLTPGMYMIRIVDVLTGTQTNEKVIINNR